MSDRYNSGDIGLHKLTPIIAYAMCFDIEPGSNERKQTVYSIEIMESRLKGNVNEGHSDAVGMH